MAQHNDKIGVGAATIIGINAMIGAGIFAMPSQLSTTVGPASLLSYIMSGAIVLSIVLALGRLSELYPGEGWGYKYPAMWGGHSLGMAASASYMTGVVVAMGFLVQQLGVWLSQYLPFPPLAIGLVFLGLIGLLVLAGAEVSSWGQYVIATGVMIPLVTVASVCWLHMRPELITPVAPFGWYATIEALPSIVFTLLGFEAIASLYRIVENPSKNVPKAAFFTVVTVIGGCMLFVAGALFSIEPGQFSGGLEQAVADVVVRIMPHLWWVRPIATTGATFAIIGTLHSMIWSVAELSYDLAQKTSCKLSETGSILLVTAATAFSCVFLKAGHILHITPLMIVPVYALSIVALLGAEQARDRRLGYIAFGCALFLCLVSGKSTMAIFFS
jgi:amino acid transporter